MAPWLLPPEPPHRDFAHSFVQQPLLDPATQEFRPLGCGSQPRGSLSSSLGLRLGVPCFGLRVRVCDLSPSPKPILFWDLAKSLET